MLIDGMELAYRYWLVSDIYKCRVRILRISTADHEVRYKCFLDALREGQVFPMENTALQEMRTRNVLR
jgi:hypothetical protein